jgi:hypothetical protein
LLAEAQGKPAEAASELGEALRLFKELRVPIYVERTERLAEKLEIPLTPGLEAAAERAVARRA